MYPLSACTFIRNCFRGAFCLFESMASWLPLVSEFNVLDMGSDPSEGTLEVLREIAASNEKVNLFQSRWSRDDASAFADAANKCVDLCAYDRVLFYQADEVPHEKLLLQVKARFEAGEYDLSFWRYQLRNNFQLMKWPPHPVHRVGVKGQFEFVDDGMNTSRTWDAKICSTYDGGWFIRWGDEFKADYTKLPTSEMILDVGKSGGFRDNIAERARLHEAFWPEKANVDGVPVDVWEAGAKADPAWEATATGFDIPRIMRFHVGRTRYELRRSLFEALKADDTAHLLGVEL